MATIKYLLKNPRKLKIKKKKSPAMESKPQIKGVCIKAFTKTPKKPNSAQRKVVKVKLSNNKIVIAAIPGEGHTLTKYSHVLIRGGRTPDLPGVKYKCIRGKFDLKGLVNRKNARSKYGTKKI